MATTTTFVQILDLTDSVSTWSKDQSLQIALEDLCLWGILEHPWVATSVSKGWSWLDVVGCQQSDIAHKVNNL